MDIVVTSKKEVKVGPVRQAFQEVFGRATVTGIVRSYFYSSVQLYASQGNLCLLHCHITYSVETGI